VEEVLVKESAKAESEKNSEVPKPKKMVDSIGVGTSFYYADD
jgi:hypothetical protein